MVLDKVADSVDVATTLLLIVGLLAEEVSTMVVPSCPRVSDTSAVLVMPVKMPVVVIPVSVLRVGDALLMIVVVGTEMTVVGIVKVV